MAEVTHDGFLGGRLTIAQPRKGYRAGVDAVLLAAAVPAQPGDTVLELGCGVGTAALCLASRVSGLNVTGVEVQADYADLARQNATRNALPFDVVEADLTHLPKDLRAQSFDHVIMNPPYFATGSRSADAARARAMADHTPLAEWLDVALRRLGPKGQLTLIQHIARLPDVLAVLSGRLGAVALRPIQARRGDAPTRFLLTGQKSARAPFRMVSPLVVHKGTAHQGDGDDYRPEITKILRDAAPLGWD